MAARAPSGPLVRRVGAASFTLRAMWAAELLAWYDRNRRELPWRRDRDPYRVWLSEVMLQQTRVDVVIPYYERFLERFPSVEALARAPVDDVLALWSGLGYYRRARQLHAAARRIGDEGFPRSAAGWRALPGVGEYTAAAVASIAQGEVVPVLDGNVERVLSRWLHLEGDPKRAAQRRVLRSAAAEMLDSARPGDSNQALMELGATVCTPSSPGCGACPLAGGCAARAAGDAEAYPPPRARRQAVKVRRVVAVVERSGRRLLFRRGDGEELLAGTWELPWADGDGEAVEELGLRYGGRWRLGERLATVRHAITHRAYEVEVREAELVEEPAVAEGIEAGWWSGPEVGGLAVSSLVPKVLSAISAGEGGAEGQRPAEG